MDYCKRQDTSKSLPAVRRMGKGRDAERMLFTARKVIAIDRKALQPSSQASELAAFYTPAKQHAPSTYLIALQPDADQHRSERSAPSPAEPWYECSCQFRTIDALIAASGDILHTAATPPMLRDARASAGTRTQLRRYRMSIFAWQRNRDDKMVRRAGSLLRACTMRIRSDLAVY